MDGDCEALQAGPACRSDSTPWLQHRCWRAEGLRVEACPRRMGWDGQCGVVMETCRFLSSSGGTAVASGPSSPPTSSQSPRSRVCAQGPPGASRPRALTPHAAVTDGNSWGEGGGQASCLWERGGERGVPLGSGQFAVVSCFSLSSLPRAGPPPPVHHPPSETLPYPEISSDGAPGLNLFLLRMYIP